MTVAYLRFVVPRLLIVCACAIGRTPGRRSQGRTPSSAVPPAQPCATHYLLLLLSAPRVPANTSKARPCHDSSRLSLPTHSIISYTSIAHPRIPSPGLRDLEDTTPAGKQGTEGNTRRRPWASVLRSRENAPRFLEPHLQPSSAASRPQLTAAPASPRSNLRNSSPAAGREAPKRKTKLVAHAHPGSCSCSTGGTPPPRPRV